MIAVVLFWVAAMLIVYTYLIYPVVVWVWANIIHREPEDFEAGRPFQPTVSLVISVHNEENIVETKISNLRSIDYPCENIEFLFGSDGSTDHTVDYLQKSGLSNLRLVVFPQRRGKAEVLNDLIPHAKGEIIVLSDANTLFEPQTIKRLVHHFLSPQIGAVSGELILQNQNNRTENLGEISYWRYENALKQWESTIGSILGATGAVYALRKRLFDKLPVGKVITDDLLIPLNIVRLGFSVKYESHAVAYENTSSSVRDEFRRKVRFGASNFHTISNFAKLLHPRYGFISFALWSHKLIRWCVPFFLLLLVGSSAVLASYSGFYQWIIGLEVVFFLLAILGLLAERLKIGLGALGFPYYFVVMNSALLVGFVKFLLGKQKPTWEIVR